MLFWGYLKPYKQKPARTRPKEPKKSKCWSSSRCNNNNSINNNNQRETTNEQHQQDINQDNKEATVTKHVNNIK